MTPESFSHYKIGINEIDDAHWEIMCLIDAITHCIRSETLYPVVALMRVVKRLTDDHFSVEELHMEGSGYPNLASHRVGHRMMALRVSDLCRESTDQANLHRGFLSKLEEVLVTHMDHDDYQYGEYLKNLPKLEETG
jgi:hemerythrin-like metal-binding protein